MIYTTKEDGKTILWGISSDDKDDAYDLVTDKNDVVIFRQLDTGKDFVYNDGDWYEFATSGGGSGGGGGTGGGVLIATVNMQTMALDKTWQEIYDADLVFMSLNMQGFMKATGLVAFTAQLESEYAVYVVSYDTIQMSVGVLHFAAESADGYPVAVSQ